MNFVRYTLYLISIITAYSFYGFPLAAIFTFIFLTTEFLIYMVGEIISQYTELLSELTKISQLINANKQILPLQVVEAQHQFAATDITPQEELLYEKVQTGDEKAANEFLMRRSLGETSDIKILPMPLKKMVIEQIYRSCNKTKDDTNIVWDDTIETKDDN